ncbi:hypothetical protein E2C01_048031 [Portunus trituberculatus]|uniref:Uncharacterized protein n=1 Tax=Portunus trituberculatus TaxID=210409 RepID=A0A5B7GC51_PORTR|nr:hypothetical protein [Portunus trituberculatus]
MNGNPESPSPQVRHARTSRRIMVSAAPPTAPSGPISRFLSYAINIIAGWDNRSNPLLVSLITLESGKSSLISPTFVKGSAKLAKYFFPSTPSLLTCFLPSHLAPSTKYTRKPAIFTSSSVTGAEVPLILQFYRD